MSSTPAPASADGESKGLVLRFTLTRDEVTRAMRDVAIRRRRLLGIAVLGVAAIAIGAVALAVSAGNAVISVLVIVLGMYLFADMVWLMPARVIRKTPQLLSEKTLTFWANAVALRFPVEGATVPWSVFGSSFETRECYLLQLRGKPGFYFIPKRALDDAETEQALRSLLSRNTDAHLR